MFFYNHFTSQFVLQQIRYMPIYSILPSNRIHYHPNHMALGNAIHHIHGLSSAINVMHIQYILSKIWKADLLFFTSINREFLIKFDGHSKVYNQLTLQNNVVF